MDNTKVASAFNEWMRRYTEEPEAFKHDWQNVTEFLAQEANGEEPTYGAECAAYLARLVEEV